jgi:dolichyl-phosphate-mannose-protein mannosyltransferase
MIADLPSRALRRARSAIGTAAGRMPQLSHPATGPLLLLMIVGGVVLRVQNIGRPFEYGFDEPGWVGAARQYLLCQPDVAECCHPPLTKLLIDVGMVLCGDNPVGWRFMSLVLGIQSIVLAYFVASALFDDRRAGWLAAAFLAADGFFIAFSRDAFSEGMMACFVLWSMLAAVKARGWGGVLVSAVLVGLAGSIKWSGMAAGLPVCFAILLRRRVPWYSLVCFLAVPIVHLVVWVIGLKMLGRPADVGSVIAEIQHRKSLHLNFPHGANPAESAWYSWFIAYHPIVLNRSHEGGMARISSSVANPVLLIAWDACLLALAAVGAALVLRVRAVRERWSTIFDAEATRGILVLTVGFVSMMLLWMSGRIVSYWYHYLTPWAFGVTLLGGIVSRLDRRYPKSVFVFVAAVLAVFIYFAPVWAELPISVEAVNHRLIFPAWR